MIEFAVGAGIALIGVIVGAGLTAPKKDKDENRAA